MMCKKDSTSKQPATLINMAMCFFIFSLLLGYATPVLSQDKPSISASLSSKIFSVDNTTTLTITVNGSRSARVNMPEIENLILHRRGQSTQLQVVNGSYTSSIASNYIIQAQKAGQYTIPSIEVRVEGQILRTEPITFEVTPTNSSAGQLNNSTTPSTTSDELNEIAFVRLTRVKDNAYIGEVIPVEIKAFFQNGLRVEIHKLPTLKGDGFVMSPLDSEPHQGSETHNGKTYSVITWKTAISPIKDGEFNLVADLNAALLFPQRNNRSRFNDPFFDDDFFGGLFGGYQKKNVTLATPKQSISILPLPQNGKPENFNGAIGEFQFEVSADPTSINVGDPITLTMKISGKGNFDRVSAPLFPTGDSWKTYSPSSQFDNNGNNYQGEKTFEQAIVAKNIKVEAVPALTFSYFDPKKNRYITKSSKPVPLTFLTKSIPQSQAQQAIAPPPPTIEQQQKSNRLPLASIRLQPGKFRSKIEPVYKRTWYLLTVCLCSLILLVTLYATLRQRYINKNSNLLEKRRINRLVTEKLMSLQQAINNNNSHDFLSGCREVIQIQLGMLWQKQPSAITPFDLQKRLPSHSPLLHIFGIAEQHAYGGGILSTDEMKDYLAQLQKEMEELS